MWLTGKALGFISVVGLVGSSIDGDGAGDATPHCVFVACVPSSFPSALVLEELAATIIFWVVDDATPSAAPAAPVAPAGGDAADATDADIEFDSTVFTKSVLQRAGLVVESSSTIDTSAVVVLPVGETADGTPVVVAVSAANAAASANAAAAPTLNEKKSAQERKHTHTKSGVGGQSIDVMLVMHPTKKW